MTKSFIIRWIPMGQASVLEEVRFGQSSQALRQELETAGGRVLRIALAPEPPSARGLAGGSSNLDVAWWCRELATFLRAGMTAVEAIETLQLQSGTGQRAQIQQMLLQALHEGKALSRAMSDTGRFPQVLIASVTASERTSTLAEALDEYLRYESQMHNLRKQAIGAAIYPAIVMIVGALIALFLLLFVMPRFSKMYGTVHGVISGPTQLMLWLSRTLANSLPEVLLSLSILPILAFLAWRLRWWHFLGGWAAENLPGLRDATNDFRSAQFYQSLALTLRGGFSLVEALQVCASLALSDRISRALARAIAAIQRGQAASQALVEAGLADMVAERLLRVGERTGQFAQVLQTLADRHSQSFATFVQRSGRLIEPLLLLLVAVMVGGIVVMMYMPIFDIANTVR